MHRKHYGKRWNCSFRVISPFPRCLPKAFSSMCSNEYIWMNGLIHVQLVWFVIHRIENIVGEKRNKVGSKYLLLFPRCFQKVSSWWSLTHSHTMTLFQWSLTHSHMPLGNKPFENTMGKGEIACKEQFLLFPQCFLPVWIAFCHFCQIWNCCLQTLSVWKSLKFVVW